MAKSSYVSKISLKILNNMKKDKKDAQSVPQSLVKQPYIDLATSES